MRVRGCGCGCGYEREGKYRCSGTLEMPRADSHLEADHSLSPGSPSSYSLASSSAASFATAFFAAILLV